MDLGFLLNRNRSTRNVTAMNTIQIGQVGGQIEWQIKWLVLFVGVTGAVRFESNRKMMRREKRVDKAGANGLDWEELN
jgi:hypothetical protein